MSLYGENSITANDEALAESMVELMLVDDLRRGTAEDCNAFVESAEAEILVEKQVLKKPTLMRLSKADDQRRRTKLIAYKMAKDNKDPEWAKLRKYAGLRKQSIAKIMKKYGKKAEKISKLAQKKYIKVSQKVQATASEKRAMNAR